jgi:hypothetical protein
MDTKEIRCPSGLRGRIRKMLGRDFHALLIDNPEEATPDQMAGLAEAIWVETIDPGPYTFETPKPRFKSDVLIGDRQSALIKSRVFTDGGKKLNKVQCPGCSGWWPDMFDYGELPYREWPDADATPPPEGMGLKAYNARTRFAAGEPCATKMDDGTLIQWSLLTGSLLVGAIKDFALQFGSSIYSETAARVVEIEGLSLDNVKKAEARRAEIFNKVTSYPDPEFWALWNDIQDHECGPETDMMKQCPIPGCNHRFGYQTDTMGFIVPALPMRSMRLRAGAQTQRT